MTEAEGDRLLRQALKPPLKEIGFEWKEELTFVRLENECSHHLSFGSRLGPELEYLFSFGVGVRFDRIQALVDDGADDYTTTIGSPLHMLRGSPLGFEWTARTAEEIRASIPSILGEFSRYGEPFLKECSDLENLKRFVQDGWRNPRLSLSIDKCFKVRLAIRFLEGQQQEALAEVEQKIGEGRGKPPKYRLPFERFQRRLLAAMNGSATNA